MIDKILTTLVRALMVIVALFILVGLGYFCFKVGIFDEMFNKTKQTQEAKKQTTKEKTNIESREVILVRHILEARDRFLKDKAEKGENFRYESKLEKLYRKQKFNPQFHCEIPDDIKVMYDVMLDYMPNDKENQIFLEHTYDRTLSSRRRVVGSPFEQPINLWSKTQIEWKDDSKIRIKKLSGDCKKLAEINRGFLERGLQRVANGAYNRGGYEQRYLYHYSSPLVGMVEEIRKDLEDAFKRELRAAYEDKKHVESSKSPGETIEEAYARLERLYKQSGEELKFEYVKETKKTKATKEKKKKTKTKEN